MRIFCVVIIRISSGDNGLLFEQNVGNALFCGIFYNWMVGKMGVQQDKHC